MKRIWGIECSRCKQRLFSFHRHDFKYCECGGTFVDGGRDYLRYGYMNSVQPPRKIYWTKKRDGKGNT